MDNWERFDETSLPDKEAFHSSLNMEEEYSKRVFKKSMQKEYSKNLIIKI